MEWLLRWLKALLPPPPGDPKKDQRWRLNVAVALWVLLPTAGVGVGMYLNRVPVVPNLVRTDDFERLAARVGDNEKELARNGKNDLRTRLEFIQTSLENLCALEKEEPVQAKREAYLIRIDALVERYQHLAGYPFNFLACGNLR